MLWIYYALLKSNVMLLITINSVGCFIETVYICFFLFYAPKKARVKLTKSNLVMQMESLKLIVLLIVVGFGLIVVLTQFLASGVTRGVIVNSWMDLPPPLGVLRQVIRTKSVEYMPILLSVALTLSAVMWFFYGLLLGDFNIAIPNVLGFTFGIIQMILYLVYRNKKSVSNEKLSSFEAKINEMDEKKVPEINDHKVIDIVKLETLMCNDIHPTVGKSDKSKDVHDCKDVQSLAMPNRSI
ncbi:SWEET sugar transporter [Cynara cardunculus var. scolymus]|uniref:Bidirectional sugar transporter SWEET n=1 Tax=Cynara cardunculus var. scolymus TaxID=59895 RepID=A0A103Y305_CYNCS|nr:SWEET sugar transporter [Cynara cardunculus var. scolymus]